MCVSVPRVRLPRRAVALPTSSRAASDGVCVYFRHLSTLPADGEPGPGTLLEGLPRTRRSGPGLRVGKVDAQSRLPLHGKIQWEPGIDDRDA